MTPNALPGVFSSIALLRLLRRRLCPRDGGDQVAVLYAATSCSMCPPVSRPLCGALETASESGGVTSVLVLRGGENEGIHVVLAGNEQGALCAFALRRYIEVAMLRS